MFEGGVDVFWANLNSDQRVRPLCGRKQELAWHCRDKEGFSHAKQGLSRPITGPASVSEPFSELKTKGPLS